MFGLYGDLPAAKDAGDAPAEASKPSWATGLAAQLKPAARKPAVHGPPPAAQNPRPDATAGMGTKDDELVNVVR